MFFLKINYIFKKSKVMIFHKLNSLIESKAISRFFLLALSIVFLSISGLILSNYVNNYIEKRELINLKKAKDISSPNEILRQIGIKNITTKIKFIDNQLEYRFKCDTIDYKIKFDEEGLPIPPKNKIDIIKNILDFSEDESISLIFQDEDGFKITNATILRSQLIELSDSTGSLYGYGHYGSFPIKKDDFTRIKRVNLIWTINQH